MRERSLLAAVIMIASKSASAPFSQVEEFTAQGNINAGGLGGSSFLIKEEQLASVIAERILIEPQT